MRFRGGLFLTAATGALVAGLTCQPALGASAHDFRPYQEMPQVPGSTPAPADPQAPAVETTAAPAATPAQDPTTRPNINPYDRDIAITVPLNFNRRVLGELPVLLTSDDRFIVDSAGFQTLINPLLTEEAQAELAASLEGIESFPPEEINATGIQLDYDPEQLAVLVLRIDPTKRLPEMLFQGGRPDAPEQPPENFTAYLNTNLAIQRRNTTGDIDAPSVFLNGAIRYKSLVFEADVQGREDRFTGEYEMERRYARFVFDQPEDYRRWYLGDLDPETRGRQGFVELGGIGVARQRRRFESFRNNVLSGSRQLVLREESTVRVLRNGLFLREFRLDPGQYDLSNLPLDTGSNDIQLEIQGQSGSLENVAYSAYLDSIDLEPGDYEYGAYLGVTSEGLFGSPDYSDGDVAFTGYWRKAFLNRPAIGLGLQAAEYAQTVTGQTQLILKNGSRLQFDASLSNSQEVGFGYAGAVSYDYVVERDGLADNWTVLAEYTSEDFSTLGNRFGQNPTSWAFSAGYARRFNIDWVGNVSASYRMSHDDTRDDSYSVNASSTYRFSPQWSAQVGVEYSNFGSNIFTGPGGNEVGVTLALIWTPRYDRRAEARYNSARDSGSVRFQQSPENRVDSFGYSLASTYDGGAGSVSGQVDYYSNRFDATLSHAAFGRDFGNITEEQVTSFRIGSAIATTGRHWAIGRTIGDSFAIVYPHESLKDSGVIVGESLEGGRYTGRSGAFGPALDNQLSSYVNQSVRYDALDAPVGYDVGEGILRVRPTYRSGYAIEVGSAAFVSALGRLVGNQDKPLALTSGRLRSLDEPEAEPQLFFTNSVGRFAIQNLEPGKRYRVELFTQPAQGFEFTVPEDSDGLLDLSVVNIPIDVVE
jgi:outer membrane usher protein